MDLLSPASEWVFIFGVLAICLLVVLIPYVFYLRTLHQTLKQIRPQHRTMPPGQVWLLLIPLFNLFWQFILIGRIRSSLNAEFTSHGAALPDTSTYNIGLTYCICFCCFWLPVLNTLGGLAGLVFWIMYWVKINECKNKLTLLSMQSEAQENSIFNV